MESPASIRSKSANSKCKSFSTSAKRTERLWGPRQRRCKQIAAVRLNEDETSHSDFCFNFKAMYFESEATAVRRFVECIREAP